MEGRRRSRRRGRCAHPTHVHSMKPPLIPPGRPWGSRLGLHDSLQPPRIRACAVSQCLVHSGSRRGTGTGTAG
eukprot:scaffold15364_cov41-Phaeocystis_antarctica.AAC.1